MKRTHLDLQRVHLKSDDSSYQRSLTQELASLDQTANSHVEIGASTAPVRYAVEWMSGQNLLYERREGVNGGI